MSVISVTNPKRQSALDNLRTASYWLFRSVVNLADSDLQVGETSVESRVGRSTFQTSKVWNNMNLASAIIVGVTPNSPEMPQDIRGFDVVTQPVEASCAIILDSAKDFEGAIYEVSFLIVLHPANAQFQAKVKSVINTLSTAWRAADNAARDIFEIPTNEV